MVDINKIRNNELTEDEKMELIADYLEQGGGGGGSSDEVVINIKNLAAPTSMSELSSSSQGSKVSQYIFKRANDSQDTFFNVEDASGNELSVQDIFDLVDAGKTLVMGELPYQGGFVQYTDDTISGILETGRYVRLSTDAAIADSSTRPDLMPDGSRAIILSGSTISIDGDGYYPATWRFAVMRMGGVPEEVADAIIVEIGLPK